MATNLTTNAPEIWESNQDAFAPPRSQRVVRGWDRAAVSAHAPRLQGHRVWKKPATRPARQHYDENEAQAELLREGAGSRKKSRTMGAKENINTATWGEIVEESSSNAPRTALTPNGRKANLDVSRSISKAATSPAEKPVTTSLLVPRKRTNDNHMITPKKNMRQTTLSRQVQRQSLQLVDSPVKELRPKKAMRKSGRRSSMGLLNAIDTLSVPVVKDQAPFDHHIDSPTATGSAQNIQTIGTPGTLQQDSKIQRTKSVKLSTKVPQSPKSPAKAVITSSAEAAASNLETTTTEAAKKSIKRSTRSTRASPSRDTDAPSTPSAARSAAIEALLNSPGEAPPTLEKLQESLTELTPMFDSSCKTTTRSQFDTQINSPLNLRPLKAEIVSDENIVNGNAISPSEALLPAASFELSATMNASTPREADEANTLFSDGNTNSLPTTIETSVDLDIDTIQGQSFDEHTVAVELESVAVLVEERAKIAQSEAVTAVVDASALDEFDIDVQTEPFVEAIKHEASLDNEAPESFELPDAPAIESIMTEDCVSTDEVESFDVFSVPSPVTTQTSDSLSGGFVLTDPTRPFSFENGSKSVLEDTDAAMLDASDDGEAESDAFEESITSPQQEEVSIPMSPSQQLALELDSEIARSPGKVSAAADTVNTATNLAYDQDDTDMLLNFVSRVKEAKKAAAVPKRKRSLPHSPLKLPLETIQDEGSTSPTPAIESELIPSTSPSKRRRNNDLTAEDEQTPRRSTRTRLPIKSQAPPGAPSFIPIRKLGGVDHDDKTVTLRRNEDKELAAITKVNTRKNKAGSVMPLVVLEKQKAEKEDPVMRQRLLKEVFDERARKGLKSGKGLCVRWAEELAQFQEFGAKVIVPVTAVTVTLGKEAKKVRMEKKEELIQEKELSLPEAVQEDGKRKVRVGVRSKIALGMAANGTPGPKRRGGRVRS